jgi:hypothetical protein
MAAFIAPVISGLSALAGIFGGSRNSTTPTLSPAQQQLQNTLSGNYTGAINSLPSWNSAYQTTGLQNILKAAINSGTNANDALAKLGIGRTTAGAEAINNQGQQQGQQISGFLNNAPIVEAQNRLSTLAGAGSFLASTPVGSNSMGGPLSSLAGGITGGTQGLASVLGANAAQAAYANALKNLQIQGNTNNPSSATLSDDPFGGGVTNITGW